MDKTRTKRKLNIKNNRNIFEVENYFRDIFLHYITNIKLKYILCYFY